VVFGSFSAGILLFGFHFVFFSAPIYTDFQLILLI